MRAPAPCPHAPGDTHLTHDADPSEPRAVWRCGAWDTRQAPAVPPSLALVMRSAHRYSLAWRRLAVQLLSCSPQVMGTRRAERCCSLKTPSLIKLLWHQSSYPAKYTGLSAVSQAAARSQAPQLQACRGGTWIEVAPFVSCPVLRPRCGKQQQQQHQAGVRPDHAGVHHPLLEGCFMTVTVLRKPCALCCGARMHSRLHEWPELTLIAGQRVAGGTGPEPPPCPWRPACRRGSVTNWARGRD